MTAISTQIIIGTHYHIQVITFRISHTEFQFKWASSGQSPGSRGSRRQARGVPLPGAAAGNGFILGYEPNERALRFGLERSYRALARLTPDRDRRIELVDMANAIRPRTLT